MRRGSSRVRWRSWLLCLAVTVGALWGLDRLFALYERTFLVTPHTARTTFPLMAMGYNDKGVHAPKKAPDEFRILFFGGSFAFGITKPPYTAASVLAGELGAAMPERRITVLNLGVPGGVAADHLAEFEFWSRRVEYDAAVFLLYPGADLIEPRSGRGGGEPASGPGLFVPNRWPLRMFDYLATLAFSWSRMAKQSGSPYFSAVEFAYPHYVSIMGRAMRAYQPERYGEFRTGIEALATLVGRVGEAARSGHKVLFVLAGPHPWSWPDLARDALTATGVDPARCFPLFPGLVTDILAERSGQDDAVLDLAPCFVGQGQEKKDLFYRTDSHWSVDGNRLAGRAMAAFMLGRWFGRDGGDGADCALTGLYGDPAERAMAGAVLDAVLGAGKAAGP